MEWGGVHGPSVGILELGRLPLNKREMTRAWGKSVI